MVARLCPAAVIGAALSDSRVITDERLVVARLRYPMGLDGLQNVVRGLERLYRDKDLVIITDGPLWREGWMVIAHRDEASALT